MGLGIHLFTQAGDSLPCGHDTHWAGALDGTFGEHFIAFDCAQCVDRDVARDALNDFALYVSLTSEKTATQRRALGKLLSATS